jgi:hypothetical protein
MEIGRTS